MMADVKEWFSLVKISDSWAVEIFIIIFVTLVLNFVVKKLFDHLSKHLTKTENLWDDALIGAAYKPAQYGVLLLGGFLVFMSIQRVSEFALAATVDSLFQVSVIALLAWFVVRFIRGVEHNLTRPDTAREPMDATTVTAIGKLLRLSVIITSVLIILQSFGYSVSGVLAFGGIGGIAVGFAAKDLLANFFGGLMIYLDRPFATGDWVRSPDRNIEGTVEDIGWRLTRIRTFDKRPIYVPNSVFANITVENPSRMTHRRIYETIGLRYEDADKLEAVIGDVRAMLEAHPDIDDRQTLIVNFDSYGASALQFFIYTFTKTTNWIEYHEVKQKILFEIVNIVARHAAQFAYPTSMIHLAKDDDESPAPVMPEALTRSS